MDILVNKEFLLDNHGKLNGKQCWEGAPIVPDRTFFQREQDKKKFKEMKEQRVQKNAALPDHEKNGLEWVILGRPVQFRLRKLKKRN